MRTLSDAKDIRARLLKRVQLEQPDAASEQVNILKLSNDFSKQAFFDLAKKTSRIKTQNSRKKLKT